MTPSLKPYNATSYISPDPVVLTTWLVEQGYRTESPRSPSEYLRLRKARSLIVVYNNGTVLLQGADLDSPRKLFTPLINDPAAPLAF